MTGNNQSPVAYMVGPNVISATLKTYSLHTSTGEWENLKLDAHPSIVLEINIAYYLPFQKVMTTI